jgi:hypothetical protein
VGEQADDLGQIVVPAHHLELLSPLQLGGNDVAIPALAMAVKFHHDFENRPVPIAVEMMGAELDRVEYAGHLLGFE